MQILDHWPTTPAKPTELNKRQLYEAIENFVTWDSAQVIETHKNHTLFRKWSGFNPSNIYILKSEILLELEHHKNNAIYLIPILKVFSSFFLLKRAYRIYYFPNVLTLFNVITNSSICYQETENHRNVQKRFEQDWAGLCTTFI